MKRFLKLLILICSCLFIMSGCSKRYTQPVHRAVTHIDIRTNYNDQLIHRHYNTPEKMRSVLLYLRLLKPYGKPVEVAENPEDLYFISISLSDGQTHFYRQAAHKYFSKENGPWKSIDPGKAAQLYGILRNYPSDI